MTYGELEYAYWSYRTDKDPSLPVWNGYRFAAHDLDCPGCSYYGECNATNPMRTNHTHLDIATVLKYHPEHSEQAINALLLVGGRTVLRPSQEGEKEP